MVQVISEISTIIGKLNSDKYYILHLYSMNVNIVWNTEILDIFSFKNSPNQNSVSVGLYIYIQL